MAISIFSSKEYLKLLQTGQLLRWKSKGNNVEIALPAFDPAKLQNERAIVIKIEGMMSK